MASYRFDNGAADGDLSNYLNWLLDDGNGGWGRCGAGQLPTDGDTVAIDPSATAEAGSLTCSTLINSGTIRGGAVACALMHNYGTVSDGTFVINGPGVNNVGFISGGIWGGTADGVGNNTPDAQITGGVFHVLLTLNSGKFDVDAWKAAGGQIHEALSFDGGVTRLYAPSSTACAPAGKVLAGTSNLGVGGTYVEAAESDVVVGACYGAGGTERLGAFVVPQPGEVLTGVGYGAGGTQLTGVLAIPSLQDIVSAIEASTVLAMKADIPDTSSIVAALYASTAAPDTTFGTICDAWASLLFGPTTNDGATFRDRGDTRDVLAASFDASGNRTVVYTGA